MTLGAVRGLASDETPHFYCFVRYRSDDVSSDEQLVSKAVGRGPCDQMDWR